MKELLHFSATWCQPCKQMQPVLDRFIDNNPDIVYAKFDADVDTATFEKFGVTGVPAFVSIVNGEIVNRHKGVATEYKLESLFS